MARRPNTAGITQIGEFLVNKALPLTLRPPTPKPPTPKPPTRGRSGGNEGYIIGPTDMIYRYSDLPKLKEQVAQNPMMARMLGDIISRLEAKDFDGTGDPLGNRQMERPPVKQPLIRPPSIEQEIEKVISGPSFPGRQTPKARDLPVRIPEPVGPITDTRTMPSMPVAPVPSPMSVPPIAIEDPDIQKVVDALPKGTRQPVQPPVTISPPTPSVFDPGPSDGTMGGTGYGKYPLGTAGPEYVYDDEGNPIMEPPVFDVPPQREVKLPDGTVIDLSDIMPQPEEERIPVDPTDPNDPMYGIFPGAEPKDLLKDFFKDEAGLKDKYPLPEGIDLGGRYFIDPITGDPMYQPPMPTLAPGELGAQVMPDPINLITGKPRDMSFIPSEPSEPSEPAVPAPEVVSPTPDTGTEGSVMEQMQKMIDELRAEQVAQQQQYQQSIADMKAQQESQQQQKMDFYQQMLADSQAQQQQRQEQEASMVPQYTMPVGPYGYNPYQSGQYQSDPYGPAGVPQMGGITTIPVPGGYGINNPVYGG